MQPFFSYNYGKGNAKRLKKGIKYVTVIAFIFAVIVWSVSMAVPEMYARLFSASDAVTAIVIFTMLPRIFARREAEVKRNQIQKG